MDVEMPLMNGLEACSKIKNTLGKMAPTIIAVTAHALDGDREKYINCGMDDYLAKPIKLNDLQKFITRFAVAV